MRLAQAGFVDRGGQTIAKAVVQIGGPRFVSPPLDDGALVGDLGDNRPLDDQRRLRQSGAFAVTKPTDPVAGPLPDSSVDSTAAV